MQLPLFPLRTVLFPGGVLPLRVFEARYMDMVRSCMKQDHPFGVVLITNGAEVGTPAETESIGTLAQIVAWDMQHLGVLHLRTVGRERFRIEEREVLANGLQTARFSPIEADEDCPLDEKYSLCVQLLQQLIADVGQNPRNPPTEPLAAEPFQAPYRFESSVWVGNRLCEVLPIPMPAKQKLLELRDATSRIEIVYRFLKEQGVLQ